MKRILNAFLSIVISFFCLYPADVHALENTAENNAENEIIIYSDLSDQNKVKEDAARVFQQYGSNIVVQVRNIKSGQSYALDAGNWVSNERQYYIGDLFHGSKGTISCYVTGSKVSNCSGTVTVYGQGISLAGKQLYNTGSKSAYMEWKIYIGEVLLQPQYMTYTVPLYEK